MKNFKQLKSLINKINFKDYKKTDSASVHYYIQITSRYGVKFFIRKKECEDCFFRQNAAHMMGFGPKPLFMGFKSKYFYYVTEHASLVKLSNEQAAEIRSKVKKMGWSTHDLYGDNVGLIRKKPVLIDFDNCTLI